MSTGAKGNPGTMTEFSASQYQSGNVQTSAQVMNERCTSTACELNADLSALSADFTRLRHEINALFPTNSTPDHVRTAVANGHRSVQNTQKNRDHHYWEDCHRQGRQPIQGVLEKADTCPVPAGDQAPASCYRQ